MNQKYCFLFVLVVSVIVFFTGITNVDGTERLIRVGVISSDPLFSLDQHNNQESLPLQILRYAAAKEKWELSLYETTLPEALSGLDQGKYDLLAIVPYEKDPASLYDYSRETVISSWAQIYTEEKGAVKSLLDLSGMVLGVQRDDPYNREIRSMMRNLNISCKFVEFNSYQEIFSALKEKWIQAGVVDRFFGIVHDAEFPALKKTDIILSPMEYRYAFPKIHDENIMSALDYHIGVLKKDPHSLYYRSLQAPVDPGSAWQVMLIKRSLIVALVLLSFTAVTVLILRWQVKVKTKALTEKYEELKQEIAMRREVEEALCRQKNHLTALHETSMDIIGRLDLADLLERIIMRAADLVGTQDGFIYFDNEHQNALRMDVAIGAFFEQIGMCIPRDTGLIGMVIGGGEPMRIDDYASWSKRHSDPVYDSLHAVMAVPLHYGGTIQGVIGLGRFSSTVPFSGDEFNVLVRFGNLAAIALNNARLYAKIEEELRQRTQAEKALEKSEERYRLVFENTGTATVIIEEGGGLSMVNSEFEMLTGYGKEEIEGIMSWRNFVLKEDLERLKTIEKDWRQGADVLADLEMKLVDKQGKVKDILAKIGLMAGEHRVVASILDISERKRLEAQLRQNQKMEAVGRLAGGIAHDINNILTPILGYTEMTWKEHPSDAHLRDRLEKIMAAGYRGRDLVAQILSFSRREDGKPIPMEVGSQVKEIIKLLRASIPTHIEIIPHLTDEPIVVMADLSDIHQIVMNLCTNSAHAMRDTGGCLEISLTGTIIDPVAATRHINLKAASYACLSITDTGCGMKPGILDQIFEPFFTTRQKSGGTGMGLSIVHGIVGRLGGAIQVYSEEGRGSVFHVYLPRTDAAAIIKEGPPAVLSPPQGRQETILVVDDEKPISEMTDEMLDYLGYEVVSTTSSDEALEIFNSHPERFDLIITDHNMPRRTGIELATAIFSIRPGIPIMLSTGYSDIRLEAQAKSAGITSLIRKPYVLDDLAQKVRGVLDASTTPLPV